jgi:YVTN family beta-propeller protein
VDARDKRGHDEVDLPRIQGKNTMTNDNNPRGNSHGMIAVDKIGTKVLFLNPVTYETEVVLAGFHRTVHELLVVPDTGSQPAMAYVPIFGDGIHGRNPNPQHELCVFDLHRRAQVATIDLYPYIAPHTLKLGPDGFIYITCENSAVVAVVDRKANKVIEAIDSGSTNGHRLIIAPDGQRLYTENEEDGTVSVIDLPKRKLLGKIKTPRPLAGIAISPDGGTVIAVDDAQPTLFLIDTQAGKVREEIVLKDVPKAAQIARYAPDNSLLGVTSLNSDTVSLIDPSFKEQTAIKVGSQPMDMAFRGDELFVACQGDGSVHIIDIPGKRAKGSFKAGTGCESLGFF